MFVAAPDRIGNDVRNGLGVLTIVKEIERCARGPRDRQALVASPFRLSEGPMVKPHIGVTRLPPLGQDEVVPVGGKMAKAKEGCSRPMGHYPFTCPALPGRHIRGELEPGGPELEMVRLRSSGKVVYTVRDPFENVVRSQPLERCLRNPGCLSLLPGKETPLVLSHRSEARLSDSSHSPHCIVTH